MTSAELIAIAAAEVGYKEKKSNSQLDDFTANAGSGNYTKYSRDLYSAGYYGGHSKQSYAWCCCFADWCFLQAAHGDRELAQNISCQSGIYGAACNYSAKYYKQAGRFDNVPSVGAQVYFGDSSSWKHTGLVEAVDASYIYTIEGNSSDGVNRRKYARTNKTILGYGHPLYSDDASCADSDDDIVPTDKPTERIDSTIGNVNIFVLRIGSKGNSVQVLQTLLNFLGGYGLEVDGSFGKLTQSAVLDYQRKNALEVDGVVGNKTWSCLIVGNFVTF